MKYSIRCLAAAVRLETLACIILAAWPASVPAGTPSDTVIVRNALGITLPKRTAARVIPETPLDVWTVGRRTSSPGEGEVHRTAAGTEVRWQRIAADPSGWFPADTPAERYAAVTIDRTAPGTMILEAMGHDFVLVNGTKRAGNPYRQKDTYESWEPRFDYSRIPVELLKGQNLLLFRYSRGRLKVRLVPPTKPVAFESSDVTMPDAVAGDPLDARAGILVINAGNRAVNGAALVCAPEQGTSDTIDVPRIPALGVRKIAFRVRTSSRIEEGSIPLRLTLLARGESGTTVIDEITLPLRVVGRESVRRETFVSTIDGSVQYYAVTPGGPESAGGRTGDAPGHPATGPAGRPALFLSLHGAGVEAVNQAASYAPKTWGVLVAPTNRRPYGFSWEDWGRLDALEVLDLVKKKFDIDEARIYLTGHSMGGHGTWFLGATYPDRFAAIGPSAGWITFQTYRFADAQEEPSQVQKMLRRAASPGDLFSLVDNYRSLGVYVLHGSIDDNVPPQQSYMMLDRLRNVHKDFEYFEQAGAGHWWDNSPEPGADCVDWRPMFDFFSRHVRPGPDRLRTVGFTTINPGISSRYSWLWIDAQERQLTPSAARAHVDPGLNRVQGITSNVSRLAIDAGLFRPAAPATVELDSQKISVRSDGQAGRLWFAREGGEWRQVSTPAAGVKNARRYGTFKEAFRNRMVLVYGTAGNDIENAWASARANYDAEKLWYQGNASIDVLADTEFDPSKDPDRNVILYGNIRTHRLWRTLLPDCPVTVEPSAAQLGEERVKGEDICCIFVRPRPGSATASVGVVSGTGIEGMRLSQLAQYLEPGLGLPDLTVFNSGVLTGDEKGIILTGFFGPDWSISSGEFETGRSPGAVGHREGGEYRAKPHPKGYVASRASQGLTIDGRLTEPSWLAAPWTDDFVDIEGSLRPLPRFRTRAKMLWDDRYLYIGAELEEPHVWATLTKRDTVIYYDNDFEVFIDPDGDNHEYYEFEMNALNTGWDLFLPKPYKDGGSAVDAWNINGLRTAVHVRGTLSNPADVDTGWCVEIAIPWDALTRFARRPVPPKDGDQWRINFSRVEWQHEIVGGVYRKLAGRREDNWVWSPQWVIDMHRPEMWGYLQFSSHPQGKAVFNSDPAWDARCVLHEVYYAQRTCRDSTGGWATTLDQLRPWLPAGFRVPGHLRLEATARGFVASIPVTMPGGQVRRWHIRQDSRIRED